MVQKFPRIGWINRKGSILIISLWLLVFLAIVALGLRKLATSQITFCRFYTERLEFHYLTQSAVEEAILERRNDLTASYDSRKELSALRTLELGNGKATYSFVDEESKININTAPSKILKRLPRMSEGLAQEINSVRQEYPFRTVEDLLRVDGISEEIFYGDADEPGLKELVTVYGRGRVNINTAPREVLLALIGEESVVERILDFRNGLDREESTADDNIFTSHKNVIGNLEGITTRESLMIAEVTRLLTVKSENYRIEILSAPTNKGRLKCEVVYSPRENAIKLWRESD